jgi:hypothetical protein
MNAQAIFVNCRGAGDSSEQDGERDLALACSATCPRSGTDG